MQKLVVAFAGLLIFGVLAAQAAPIPGIVSTGAGLAEGDTDLNFLLISAPDGVPTGVSPVVVRSTVDYGKGPQPAFPLWPGAWVPNDDESQWLGLNDSYSDPGPTGFGPSDPAGWYTWVLVFNLPDLHAAQTASISGWWSADNRGELYLNDVLQATCGFEDDQCFLAMHAVTIASGFQPGVNYLQFRVFNEGRDTGNPTGFRFAVGEASYEVAAETPEPSTVALLICGLGGLVLLRRHKAS